MVAAVVLMLVRIGVWISRRRRRVDPKDLLGSALAVRAAAHARTAAPDPDAVALVQQVRMLLDRRRLVQAVKVWRDATGVPWADAVKAVTQIENGTMPMPPPGQR